MSKAPAFQFYADKFMSGTAHMTVEEVGGYIRLLCYQWENGSIPESEQRQLRVAGCKKGSLLTILEKFTKTEKGLVNLRLEESRAQQERFREKQKVNGGLGGRPKKDNPEKLKPIEKETQENPSLIFGLSETEPKKSPSSSSSSTYNDLCIRARDMTCNFFSVTEQKNFRAFKEITEAVALIDQKEQSGYYIQQLEAYNKFKSLTGQQKCNYITWLFGESIEERHIDNGHWCRTDYENQIKEITANGKSNQKNNSGTRRAATAAIESGSIKDFGPTIKL